MDDFWNLVNKTENCWLWTGTLWADGYGRYKQQKAHRVALELALGRPIAPGMFVAHAPIICHTKNCVNPDHLREATPKENMEDRLLDSTDCKGTKNGRCKLTQAQVIAIRNDPRIIKDIAKNYGIHWSSVSDIKTGRSWSWLQ